MDVTVEDRLWLRFGPEDPVRGASGVVRFGDGWLVAQDDAVHAAWWRPADEAVERVRLFDDRQGHATFAEAAGTKRLKPDLEAACPVTVDGSEAVLLLGSGSLAPRTVGVLVSSDWSGSSRVRQADLAPLYERVRDALGMEQTQLNLEGACVVDGRLRWFQRGHGASGVPSASVDVNLQQLIEVFGGDRDPASVGVRAVRRYELGELDGLALAVTDAVAIGDGMVCVSASAEDAPDPVADGPIAGSALAVIDGGGRVRDVVRLPAALAGCKVEGLAAAELERDGARLLAVVDQDDPRAASTAAWLRVDW